MAARVERDALVAAGVALLNMSAERGGTAQLDRAHRAPLRTTEPIGMGLPVLRAAAAEDVRHLEWCAHARIQKYSGSAGRGGMASGCGRRSKGLVVAHTVLVASFR